MADLVGKQFTHYFAFEPSFGLPPTAGTPLWQPLTLYTTDLGGNDDFQDDPTLGRGEYNGRDPGEGAPVLPTAGGNMTAPLCLREAGWWLKAAFGAPVTTEDAGVFTHVFESGKDVLPTMFRQQRRASDDWRRIGGVGINTLSIRAAKESGFAQIAIGAIAQKELLASAALAGTLLDPYDYLPVPNSKALAKWGGVTINNALTGTFNFTNNSEALNILDGQEFAAGITPGFTGVSGSVDVRYRDQTWVALAAAGTEAELSFEWALSASAKLTIAQPNTKLKKASEPISGPGPVTGTYNYRARQDESGPAVIATLINDVEAY